MKTLFRLTIWELDMKKKYTQIRKTAEIAAYGAWARLPGTYIAGPT
jgi:hypothetical protein